MFIPITTARRQVTMKHRNVVYHIPHWDCPNANVGQIGRQLSVRAKEHKGAVRRQDEDSLLTLQCLTTGCAFDRDRASVIGKGTTRHTGLWNTTSTCGNQCVTLDPCCRALRDYWQQRRQVHSPISKNSNASAETHTHHPLPLSPMFLST